MYIYYPSCNFSAASPATAKKVKAYFEKQMPVAGCCRVDKREISPADIALYICQACRETLEDKVKTQSMWEYLDALKDFNFPNQTVKNSMCRIAGATAIIRRSTKPCAAF